MLGYAKKGDKKAKMAREIDAIRVHDEHAVKYDQQVRDYKWFGHDVLFGMSFEYVNPDDRLLDLGIGTGLSSQAFADIGLEIFGVDGSVEMLNACRSKGFAKELKQFDLKSGPLPYPDSYFNHVICCGVLHFFGDVESLFKDISRVMKPGGVFAFITQLPNSEESEKTEGYVKTLTFDTPAFTHSDDYISEVLKNCGLEKLKELRFLAWHGPDSSGYFLCMAYVARKSDF
jgi:predicted TPR repeat methyltransferase